jgi:Domain of unknown function (DUF4296)
MKCAVVFSLLLGLISCTARHSLPSDIIPIDSMENVMRDVVQADQFAQVYLLKDSLLKDSLKKRNVKVETLQLYDEVFRIHRVSRESFKKSMEFYAARPDLTKIILDTLSARGLRDKSFSYRRMITIPKKTDTVKKALHP